MKVLQKVSNMNVTFLTEQIQKSDIGSVLDKVDSCRVHSVQAEDVNKRVSTLIINDNVLSRVFVEEDA